MFYAMNRLQPGLASKFLQLIAFLPDRKCLCLVIACITFFACSEGSVDNKDLIKAVDKFDNPEQKEAFIRMLMGMSNSDGEQRARQQLKRRNLMIFIGGVFFLLLFFAFLQLTFMAK